MSPAVNRRACNRISKWLKRPSRPTTIWSRPRLWSLEDRATPANAALSSGILTIDYTVVDGTLEAVTASNDGVNITLTGNVIGSTVNPVGSVSQIVAIDSGGGSNQFLTMAGTVAYSLSGGLSSTGVEAVTISRAVNATSSGAVSVTAPKNISVNADLSTDTGDLTLKANDGAPFSGNFVGIDITAATISTTSGKITLVGTGGNNSGGNQHGVSLSSGGVIQGGSGPVSVTGKAGASTGHNNRGVSLSSANAKITSTGGDVAVTGFGGGSGSASANYGVYVSNDTSITAGGSGSVTVNGTGGGGSGVGNVGVHVITTGGLSGAAITSSGGNVKVSGTGGGTGSSASSHGVAISGPSKAAVITAGGSGTVEVIGQGGTSAGGNANLGVSVSGASGKITSSGGDVTVTGTGGGGVLSSVNYGVAVQSAGAIVAGGSASVTVTGIGGMTTGATNYGVFVTGLNSSISAAGNVKVSGTGGGFDISHSNYGVHVWTSGIITCTGLGTVEVIGQGSTFGEGASNHGVFVLSAKITSNGGDVSITGTGGGFDFSGSNLGVYGLISATMSAGGTGNLTIVGKGGNGSGTGNHGVALGSSSTITAGGSVTVTGTEGTGTVQLGFVIQNTSKVTCGVAGNITLIADTSSIDVGSAVTTANTATLRQRTNGRAIDIGGADVVGTKLGLTDAELDRVTAGLVQIGDVNSGTITVSAAITRSASTALALTTSASIGLNATMNSVAGAITLSATGAITQTAGIAETSGTLTVNSGATVTFASAGNNAALLVIPSSVTCIVNGSFDSSGLVQVDGTLGGKGSIGTVTVTSTGKIAPGTSPGKLTNGNVVFNSTSEFVVELNGTAAGTDYDQLLVNGTVNLGGAKLLSTVGFTPTPLQVFTIIDNDGSLDDVTGTFNGHIEGATVTLSGFDFTISYKGGDGNDVTLTRQVAIPPAPTVTGVTFGDGSNQRSMVTQMVVTFSEAVNFSGDVADAFTLSRSGSGVPTGNVALTTNPITGPASSVTITFAGSLTTNGSLNDGFYDFAIDADQVTGVGGKLDGGAGAGSDYAVVGNTTNQYFRLFGDGNGDGTTNLGDFAAFRSVFNLGAHAAFDYGEGDNNVGLADFAQFRGRFNLAP